MEPSGQQLYYDQKTGEYYTQSGGNAFNLKPKRTIVDGLGGLSTKTPKWNPPAPYSVPFAQNPYLVNQVGQFGQVPQWMMDAYTRKMAGYGVPNGGFPATGGKPTQPNSGAALTPGGQS